MNNIKFILIMYMCLNILILRESNSKTTTDINKNTHVIWFELN